MSLKERLEQAQKDKAKIEENIRELEKQINEHPKPKNGDIWKYHGEEYLIIITENKVMVLWSHERLPFDWTDYCLESGWPYQELMKDGTFVTNIFDNPGYRSIEC